MGTLGRAVSVALLLLLGLNSLQSGEDKELRALITKAIKARGAEENEAKYKALNLKGDGTFYGLGDGIPYTAEWHFKGEKQSRFTLEFKNMGTTLTFTKIISGDKGWNKINDEVKPMPADELAEEKEEMYAKWVSSVRPLKDKAFKLAALGEIKIGDKAAVGVRVSRDGKRDINLYFDPASGMLLKNEYQVKDIQGGANKEMQQETFFTDYKDFKGSKYPTKITINRDGKRYVEAVMTEVRPLETVDDALFAKP
jgi:hypothetical protein